MGAAESDWFGVALLVWCVRTGLAPVLVLVVWRPGCAADWFDQELLLLALAVLAHRGHTAALSLSLPLHVDCMSLAPLHPTCCSALTRQRERESECSARIKHICARL